CRYRGGGHRQSHRRHWCRGAGGGRSGGAQCRSRPGRSRDRRRGSRGAAGPELRKTQAPGEARAGTDDRHRTDGEHPRAGDEDALRSLDDCDARRVVVGAFRANRGHHREWDARAHAPRRRGARGRGLMSGFLRSWSAGKLFASWIGYWILLIAIRLGPAIGPIWRATHAEPDKGSLNMSLGSEGFSFNVLKDGATLFSRSI